MLQVRNKAALTTPIALAADEVIPFDVSIASNGVATFDATDNAVIIHQAGIYWLVVTVTGVSGAAGSVSLQAYSDGVALDYAAATEVCDGKNAQSITLAVPVNAVTAGVTDARITFRISAAFTMSNAFGGVQLVV